MKKLLYLIGLIAVALIIQSCEKEPLVNEKSVKIQVKALTTPEMTVEDYNKVQQVNAWLDMVIAQKLSNPSCEASPPQITPKSVDSSVYIGFWLPPNISSTYWYPELNIGFSDTAKPFNSFSCVINSDSTFFFDGMFLETVAPFWNFSGYVVAYAVGDHWAAICAAKLGGNTYIDGWRIYPFMISSHGYGNLWWSTYPDHIAIGSTGWENFNYTLHNGYAPQ